MRIRLMRSLSAVLIAAVALSGAFGWQLSSTNAASFGLTVTDGTIVSYGDTVCPANTSSADIPEGALVTVRPNAPTAGQFFSSWDVVGNTITLPDAISETTSFQMPSDALSIAAIFKSAVILSGVTVGNVTYGDAVSYDATGITFKDSMDTPITTLDKSHCLFLFSGRNATSYASSAAAPTHAGEYTLTVVLKPEVQFAGRMTVDFTIEKAPVSIHGITAVNRAFDGTDRVALDTTGAAIDAANSRIPAAEAALVSISIDPDGNNVFGTAQNGGAIGTGVSVAVSGVGCAFATPALASDYTVSVAQTTVDIQGYAIAESDLVLTGTAAREYDGTASAITAAPGSSLPNTLAFLVKDGRATAAGTHTALIFFDDGTPEGALVSGNYSLPAGGLAKEYTITPKPIDLTWSGAQTRVYDAIASAVTAAIPDGAILGADQCSVSVSGGTEVNAGSHTATAAFTGTDSANYAVSDATKEKTYAITQKAIALGTLAVSDKTYDGATAGTLASAAFTGLCGTDALTMASSDYAATLTFPQTGVGQNLSVSVSVTLGTTATANNYTFMSADAVPVATRTAQATATGKILPKAIAGALAVTLSSDANANGKADAGDVLLAAYQPTDATGAQPAASDLAYQWKRAGADIPGATAAQYTVTDADAGKLITCAAMARGNFTGSVINTTGISGSLLPLTGSVLISGTVSVGQTLTASLAGGIASSNYTWKWFRNATEIAGAAGNAYIVSTADLGTTLYAKAIAVTGTGAAYTGEITGSILIPAGTPAAPVIDLASDTGTLSVSWNAPDSHGSALLGYLLSIKRAGTEIPGSPFSLTADKTSFAINNLTGGASFTATLTAINAQGRTDSNTPAITVRAPYAGSTPDAPTRYSRSTSSVTLTAHNGYEYSRDGSSWQDSNTFKGLKSGTSYSFYQRVKETSTHDHSETSPAYTTSTLSSSSGGGTSQTDTEDDDSSSSSSTGGSTSGTSATDKLYELTVAEANTNILYSTMNKLIRGNAERDVTITFPRITYTFAKGTMTGVTGKVWYDLGVSIDNCVHTASIETLAGDARVLTLHFNYDGTLPGDANIGIFLGTQFAGQTMYYYKYDEPNGSLVFQQNTTVDANGWASVHQTSCSDYVMLNRDISGASATPSLEPALSPSPTPTATSTTLPVETTADPVKNKFDWQLAGIIGGAALVLLGILWLCLKKRSSDYDDEDDE